MDEPKWQRAPFDSVQGGGGGGLHQVYFTEHPELAVANSASIPPQTTSVKTLAEAVEHTSSSKNVGYILHAK